MAKQIQSYKLGVQIEADDRKATPVLQNVEKQTKKNVSAFKDLGSQITSVLRSRDVDAGKSLGKSIGGNIVGGIKDSIANLGSTIGSTIGTAIAPGIGTAIGGAIGTAVQTGLEKAAGPVLNMIQRGLELNDQLELAQVHYTAFIGSEAEAFKHLDDLKKLSVSAGLDLPMLLQADQRLEEFNKDVKLSVLELQAAADASAAFGSGAEGFKAIADTLGLIAEKGELTSKVLQKLDKQNVPALKYLSEATGMSERRLKELMAQGRIKGDVAARLIAEGIERHQGGYAAYRADNTSIGLEAKKNAAQDQLAMKGTNNFQRVQDDWNRTVLSLYQSSQAQQFVEFLDKTAGKIIDLAEKGVKVGAGLTEGVAQGVTSGKSMEILSGAMNRLGNTAIDTMKDVFVSHSPSEVFAGIGSDAVIGLAYGKDGTGGFASPESKAILHGAISELASGAASFAKEDFSAALSMGLNKSQATVYSKMKDVMTADPDFLPTLQREAVKRGFKPDDILNLIGIESGFNKSVVNQFGYGGFSQIGRSERKSIGLPYGDSEARQLFATKSASWQLLNAFFPLLDEKIRTNPALSKRRDLTTMYAAWGSGRAFSDDQTVLATRGGKRASMYKNNPLWDFNKDGTIQQWELGAAAQSKLGAGVKFSVNGAELTNSNPMPVSIVGDLSGGADSFKPSRGRFASFDAGEGSYEAMRTGREPSVSVGVNYDSFRAPGPSGMPSLLINSTSQALQDLLPELQYVAKARVEAAGLDRDILQIRTILTEGAQVATSAFLIAPPVIKKSVEEVGKSIRDQYQLSSEQIKLNHKMLVSSMREQLGETLQGITGFLPSGGGQTGGKKGFFSKLLGIAAPFLSFIPGAGPILSTIAGAASQGLVGNWAGAASTVLSNSSVQGLFHPSTKIASSGGSFGSSPGGANPFAGPSTKKMAFGGPVQRGRAYLVGDGGRTEIFAPNEDGRIYPSTSSYGSSRGGDDAMHSLLQRMHETLSRLQTVPMDHVVRMGARGLLDAMDGNSGLQDGMGRRLQLT